jgi:zinc transporter 7
MAMAYLHPRRIAILLAFAVVCVCAQKHAASVAAMSIPEIEDKLQVSSRDGPFARPTS